MKYLSNLTERNFFKLFLITAMILKEIASLKFKNFLSED